MDSNTSTLKCVHCNNEHLVRREAGEVLLEAFARCPKCRRNDRVEKVSSIIRSHSQEIVTTETRTEEYFDKNGKKQTQTIEIPKKHSQTTELARSLLFYEDKPEPIPRPLNIPKPDKIPKPKIINPNKRRSNYFAISIVLFVLLLCLFSCLLIGIVGEVPETLLICGLPILLIFIGGIITFVLGLRTKKLDPYELEAHEKNNQQKIIDWHEENKRIIKDWKVQNQLLISDWKNYNRQNFESWQNAMKNWSKLYFCYRDDCVFIPGNADYAPVDNMISYLYKDYPKPNDFYQ